MQFSSTPDTELQGICYMVGGVKLMHTLVCVVCLGISHPLERREQGEVTEGIGKLIPSILAV